MSSTQSTKRPTAPRPAAARGDFEWTDPSLTDLSRLAISSGQCAATPDGALVLGTGELTGRAPSDRYIVRDSLTAHRVDWGPHNQPVDPRYFELLEGHLQKHLASRARFTIHRHAGGPEGTPVVVQTSSAAHAIFCHHLLQAQGSEDPSEEPLRILHSPDCFAIPSVHGTRAGTFIAISLQRRTILIGGTGYAGEIKKSVFSYLNFVLPARGILTMHAAVNVDSAGESAVFFGLSGTGKTTLSADPQRYLLGDDEHGWSDAGLFNLEGGCYAKTIHLSQEHEPDIWQAVHSRHALLENVVIDPRTGDVDFDDDRITENTRGAYSLEALPRTWSGSVVRPPRHILFLTADAFGVLPAVAKLSPEQALRYFLAGYTAKVAGTEAGQKLPQPTFSACFGAPFMPLPPLTYARLLQRRAQEVGPACGWSIRAGSGAPSVEGSESRSPKRVASFRPSSPER